MLEKTFLGVVYPRGLVPSEDPSGFSVEMSIGPGLGTKEASFSLHQVK